MIDDGPPSESVRSWTVAVPAGYRIGAWEVLRPLASGSWSAVYEARRIGEAGETTPDRAALKILPTGTSTRRLVSHLQDMVVRESRRHADLHHERLVTTYEVLTVDDAAQPALDGAAVLVMELASGSLADVVAKAAGRPLPEARRYLSEIAQGLQAMHAEGWVHGDLKPSNVLIRTDGSCCLADFGLAAVLDGTHAYVPPLATPDFAPPERRTTVATSQGQQIRPADDVWAFGVVACLLLTGAMPFPGSTSWQRAHAVDAYCKGGQPLTLQGDLGPDESELVAACLAALPQDRPTAAGLVTALTGTPDPQSRRRYRVRAARLASAVVALLAAGAVWTWASAPAGTSHLAAARQAASGHPAPSVAAHATPSVTEGKCLAATREQKDALTGIVWHQVWFCRSTPGALQYLAPDGQQVVGWMVTPTSWFLCYRHGAAQPTGSDIWYYTQGDYTAAGWQSRLAWGYTPARYVLADPQPYPGIPLCPHGT